MVLGAKDRIPEEEEDKSGGKSGGDENSEPEKNPLYSRKELKDKLWKITGEGHLDELIDILQKVKDFENYELLLNEENEDFDEDGNNLLLYCIKEGCDSGPAWGRHFHKCAEILIENNVNINHHNKAGHTPLFEAVFHKNTSYMTMLLHHNAETDRYDQDGLDPLHLAIHLGYKDCFKLLVQHENQEIYNRKDGTGVPPLVAAVQHGHLDLCQLLLDGGCDVNASDKKLQRNALHYAVIAKRFDIFELILKYKPKLDHSDHKGRTILHRVCAIPEPRYLKKLLHGGFDITTSLMDQESDDGLTPVIIACQNGNAEQLKDLLEEGSSVTTTDKTGKSSLHYCADNLETQCAEMLLMRDESLIHIQDEQGFTPLHMAVIGGNVPLLKLLVRKGADVNVLDSDGHTPSHWATVCTHLEILDVLIENDAELSKCDNHNAYPIHYAAQMNGRDNGHSDVKIGEKVLKKLLDSSIPFDVLDKDRRQPLLWAASAGNSDSCKLLANAGADVNSIDKDGLTALHCAASRGHSDCVDRLKKLGAEVNVADTNGCTALFYAITLGNKECTRLLLKYGADPNHKDSRGRTPTHCAAIKGCLETVKMLDKSKAELWFASFRGDCPIHEAAQGGHCDVVKYLLKAKNTPEAVNTANDAGRTCLHISAIVNNLQLCKLLLDNNADKNSIMKNKTYTTEDSDEDKAYTPYDAAIIKGNNEIAEYIRSKGGVTGGDIDNILQAKGKKRDAKSAKSRKSVQTLESTPEEAEPEDNKKVDEKTKVEPVEDDNKKKDKGKKKEKEEKEREKEKLVIVPKDKQKKKDQEEKGKEDQKESEKEKVDEDQEGKGEKKELSDKELKELQDRIKAGEGAVDERDIKRKAIKDLGEKQKLDDVVEEDQEEKEKEEDLTEEEQKDLEAKIKAGQSDLDERDKKQKEGKETEDQKKKDKNKTDKKEGEKDVKGKKKDLSDKEQKAGQKKVKSGDKTERDKKQKKTEEEKKEKGGKPDLTDTEVAAITAAVVIATDKDKKDQDQKTKDKKDQDQKTKDKKDQDLKTKDKKDQDLKTKDKKDQDQKTKDKKDKDQFEGLDIPPSSPDLRDPKQKTKDKKEQDQKTKDGIDQQDQTSKDKKDQDQKTKDKKDQDKKIKDKKDQDLKTKDKKDQDQKTKDKKDQFEGLAIPPSSPDLRDPKQKTKDEKEQDQKTKDGIDQDQTSKDKKDQDQKIKDKKDQDQFEGLAIPPSSPDLRDPKQKTKDKKDQDQKSKDKKDQDQKIKDKKDQDQKSKDKKDQDQKTKDKKGQDQTTKRKEDQFEGTDIPPSSPDLRDPKQKTKDKKDQDQKSKDKKDQDQKIKDKKDQDQKIKDKKGQDQTTKRKEDQFEGTDIPLSSPDLSDPELKRKEKDKDDQASGEDTSDRDQDQESSEERADELDSQETRKKRGSGKQDSKEKKEVHVQIPAGAFERSPVATASNRSRRDSPVKYRDSRSRSKSSDTEEFEFPEGAHENTEAAIAAAEARRKARERSRSRSTDRASVEKQTELRKYSKVNTDGRIQPGLLAEKDGRNRRFDERDTPSPLDSEDEFIDDPYFGRRIKTYGGGLRLGNKRIDNREKILREKSELKRKRQLEKMSRSSQRLPTRGGVSRMLPLGYSRLETPQRPITRKSNSIQESVRRYQTERTFVRQLHQLKRAQIYTGPMHDIVLFSKLMDVYKNSSANDSELDIDSQALDDWDGYLQDQLRFVSHYYEDDRTGLRDIKGDAKEYHHQLEKSATDAKKTVESRIDHIIKQNEKDETAEREEREKIDKKISNIAEKTGHMLDNVRQQANESVAGARDLNSSLEEEMRRERQDRLKYSKYSGRNEKAWLLEQEAIDNRQSRMDEQDKERKEKHKEWMRKKDEEMRRKLMKVYGPTPVFDPFVSKRTSPKASTPKPNLNFNSRSSSRPKSMMSSISGSRSRPQDQELEVHMTEFGMRRVKRDEFSFAKMSTPHSQSYVRPAALLPANWTPKYDGINLRPRAGLVFVEPTVYDEVLKEEQMIRTGQTRNSMRNLTLETDNNMLETVDL